ncbi:MAG: Do family serine endopeptidase [Magnetococcales bacterium]|nr:Do family serine endopeptidase [Magnetococcales bacterium]
MKKRIANWGEVGLIGLGLVWAAPLWAGLPFAVDGQKLPSLADMVERVIPGVVNIATTSHVSVPDHPLFNDPFFRRFFDLPAQGNRQRESKSLGSGVVIDAKQGYVLTNQHVIDKADAISVTLRDGSSLQAKLVGVDKETDVAVIQVPAKGLQAVPLGDSDALRVGDFVVAMGNPFGLGQTVTSGIVSALGRKGLGIKGFEDFIQTDASINPGNSGGALVDLAGKLVGINTAILSPGGGKGNVGIGFAIPINMARQVMTQLVEHGEVRRGLLGAQAQDLTPELAKAFGMSGGSGAAVTRVVVGSAAYQAGLRPGDVVIEANGRPVRKAVDLHTVLGLAGVGDKIPLKVIRDHREQLMTVVLSNPEVERIGGDKIDARLTGAIFGINVEDGEHTLVKVVKVAPKTPAWNANLREEDRILSVNRKPVPDFAALTKAVQADDRQMLIHIQRGEERFFVLVR